MKSIKEKAVFENLANYLNYVWLFAKDNDLSNDFLRKITLAVEELLVNVISYAYPKDSIGEVELSLSISKETIKINIIDSGIPFNILKVKAPDTNLPLHKRGIGGMGIHFVKKLADKIEYERKAGENHLTIFKKIS